MIVQPPQLAALDWMAAAAGTLARPWKAGSIVSGRVLEFLSATRLVLQINGLKVEADAPSPGSLPRQFQARVLSEGPQPVLELLSQSDKTPPTAAPLRARLPRQGGLQPLLSDLRALASTPAARALPEPVRLALARLEASIADQHDMLDPDVLRDTLQRSGMQLENTLLQHARTPEHLPTTQVDYDIKAALQRLGQALQRLPQDLQRLPQDLQPLPQDLPAPAPVDAGGAEAPPPLPRLPLQPLGQALQELSQASPPRSAPAATTPAPAPASATAAAAAESASADAPPPLLRLPLQPQARLPLPATFDVTTLAGGMLKHVDAALARIEIMQLEAHPASMAQACMLEVPVRDGDGFDVLQVRIEQDDAAGAQVPGASSWTLGFTLEPPDLGAIHGHIRLRGAQVNVDLWAQHDRAVQALEEQTAVLSRLLNGSGLQLAQLRVRHGTPLRHTGLGRSLLEASA